MGPNVKDQVARLVGYKMFSLTVDHLVLMVALTKDVLRMFCKNLSMNSLENMPLQMTSLFPHRMKTSSAHGIFSSLLNLLAVKMTTPVMNKHLPRREIRKLFQRLPMGATLSTAM